jgi:hypothetical protein
LESLAKKSGTRISSRTDERARGEGARREGVLTCFAERRKGGGVAAAAAAARREVSRVFAGAGGKRRKQWWRVAGLYSHR